MKLKLTIADPAMALKLRASFLLLSLLLVVGCTRPQVADASEIRKCGKELVNLVVRMCNGCVNGGTVKRFSHVFYDLREPQGGGFIRQAGGTSKRSGTSRDQSEASRDDSAELQLLMTSPLHFYSNPHGQRVKRQIAEECCINKCSYSTLKKYCCEA